MKIIKSQVMKMLKVQIMNHNQRNKVNLQEMEKKKLPLLVMMLEMLLMSLKVNLMLIAVILVPMLRKKEMVKLQIQLIKILKMVLTIAK